MSIGGKERLQVVQAVDSVGESVFMESMERDVKIEGGKEAQRP